MKKALLFVAVLCLVSVKGFAADPFDEFKNTLVNAVRTEAQTQLDSFAKDLGSLMGGGSFHQGKSLGFPGFDVGVHVPIKSTSDDNKIVKAAKVDTILLPVAQAELGLPAKIDLLVRYSALGDAKMVGYGVRYGLFKSIVPAIPSVSVQATFNSLDVNANANKFKATTASVGAALSFGIPIVNPYIGAGLDSTTVEPDSTITDLKGTASGTRLEAGINLTLFPFTYMQLGAAIVNGDTGYTAGFGVKF